jgi:hypothetical protein
LYTRIKVRQLVNIVAYISVAICKFLSFNVWGMCKLTLGGTALIWFCKHTLRLRHNEEVCDLLDGPYIVKYMKFKRLLWAGHIVQWIILEYQNWNTTAKAAATLEPESTQHSKPTFVWAYITRHMWLHLI